MLIPIGHDAGVFRTPYATIALIVINVVLFGYTFLVNQPSTETEKALIEVENQLIENEFALMKFYDEECFDRVYSLSQEETVENDEIIKEELLEFREKLKQNYIFGIPANEYALWKDLFSYYEELSDQYKQESEKLNSLFYTYGFVPAKFNAIGLLTSMYLHAGLLHLIGNMIFLWIAGGLWKAGGESPCI